MINKNFIVNQNGGGVLVFNNFKAETHPLTKDTQDRTSKELPICVVLFVVCVSQFNLNLLNFQEETF